MTLQPSLHNPKTQTDLLLGEVQPKWTWRQGWDSQDLAALKEDFLRCLGTLPEGPPALEAEEIETLEYSTHVEKRFRLQPDVDTEFTALLLLPKGSEGPWPVVLCLQGHSQGAHVSLARKWDGSVEDWDGEPMEVKGDRDFAIQALARGYAVLLYDQRCFGRRRVMEDHPDPEVYSDERCRLTAMRYLLAGRTLVGQRCWDVTRACDFLETRSEVDAHRMAIFGHSGGGTIAFYAPILEPRIKAIMTSCALCPYVPSLGHMANCSDNYLPSSLLYFDMPDLAALLVDRSLVNVFAHDDIHFPYEGSLQGHLKVEKIFSHAGLSDHYRHFVGDHGHRFYVKAWNHFQELFPSG